MQSIQLITKKVIFFFFFFSFLACNQVPLVQELDQRDANEIMVVLSQNGIDANKESVEKQQQTSWKIMVPARSEHQARELLVANNLPRQKQLGLLGVCKDAGLIPTPKTEKCRELLALKGEIINSLESIPGVVDADVVINIPDKEDFPDEKAPPARPTASVVVQIGSHFSDVLTESKVQQFVANAVTGMDVRDVAVLISRAPGAVGQKSNEGSGVPGSAENEGREVSEPAPLLADDSEWATVAGLRLAPESAKKFKVLAVFLLVFFAILSATVVIVLFKMARLRAQGLVPTGLQNPALPEKMAMDQLVHETRQTTPPA